MAGLNIIPVQENILAYVRSEFPGYEVYEDVVIDDDALQRVNNNVNPYIVIRWGNISRNPRGASFVGTRFDEYISSFNLSIIAPTPKQCRKALNIFMDTLIGWQPVGGTPLILESSGVFIATNDDGRPHVFVGSATFSFAANMENPGEHITP